MTKTDSRMRPRSPFAFGYCRTCGLYRFHWAKCPEVDRDHQGKEIK